jgi:hypothetical protein
MEIPSSFGSEINKASSLDDQLSDASTRSHESDSRKSSLNDFHTPRPTGAPPEHRDRHQVLREDGTLASLVPAFLCPSCSSSNSTDQRRDDSTASNSLTLRECQHPESAPHPSPLTSCRVHPEPEARISNRFTRQITPQKACSSHQPVGHAWPSAVHTSSTPTKLPMRVGRWWSDVLTRMKEKEHEARASWSVVQSRKYPNQQIILRSQTS